MDDALFAAGYNGGFGALVARAYALTGDLDAARSLVQESYVRAAVRRSEFADADDVGAFVWTTVNALHESNWLEKHPAPFGDLSVPGGGPSPAVVALQAELAQLPAPVRRSLIDRDLFGWDARETARDLVTDTATVPELWNQGVDVLQRHPAAWLEAGHAIPSAPLPYAELLGEARRRERKRTGRAALATVVALAVVGAGTALALHRPSAPSPSPGPSTSATPCPLPAAWRTAFSPDGQAWLQDAYYIKATGQGFAAYTGQLELTLRWYPRNSPVAPIELDRGASSGGSEGLGSMDADGTHVFWIHGRALRMWDGTTTTTLAPEVMSAAFVDHGIDWVDGTFGSSKDPEPHAIHRYDFDTRSVTKVRDIRVDPYAAVTIFDHDVATHFTDGHWEITDLVGNPFVTVTDPGFNPLGSYRGAPVWVAVSNLRTEQDHHPIDLWRKTKTDANGSVSVSFGGSLSNDFLVYAARETLGVYDLRTGQEAEAARYSQHGEGWEAVAQVNPTTGVIAYYGYNNSSPQQDGSRPTATPDGGPRFTPIASLPRIQCSKR